jgi:hypothetical protein
MLFGLNNRLIDREGKQNSTYGVWLIFFAIRVAYAKQICLPSQARVLIMLLYMYLPLSDGNLSLHVAIRLTKCRKNYAVSSQFIFRTVAPFQSTSSKQKSNII